MTKRLKTYNSLQEQIDNAPYIIQQNIKLFAVKTCFYADPYTVKEGDDIFINIEKIIKLHISDDEKTAKLYLEGDSYQDALRITKKSVEDLLRFINGKGQV